MCPSNPAKKGPFFCRVPGCVKVDHPFSWNKNLNAESGQRGRPEELDFIKSDWLLFHILVSDWMVALFKNCVVHCVLAGNWLCLVV